MALAPQTSELSSGVASQTLLDLIEKWADSAIKTRDLVRRIEEQAIIDKVTDAELRERMSSALKKRHLGDRQISRLLPTRLKNHLKVSAGKAKKRSADMMSAASRVIVPVSLFGDLRKLQDAGSDFQILVQGKTVVGAIPIVEDGVKIKLVSCSENNLLYQQYRDRHYVPNRGCIGKQLHYLIYVYGKLCGIISGSSAVWSVKSRDTFFGITKGNRRKAIQQVINNLVFRLENNTPNLASQILALWRKQVVVDWQAKYGDDVIGFETFVYGGDLPEEGGLTEVTNFDRTGVAYKADNWSMVGMTMGVGKHITSKETTVIKDAMRDGKKPDYADAQIGYVSRYKTPKKIILCRWADQKKQLEAVNNGRRSIVDDDLKSSIEKAWCKDTSYSPEQWSENNKAYGQCAVTALYLQERLGGNIAMCKVDGYGNHFFNVLPDGKVVDLTKKQFAEGTKMIPVKKRQPKDILRHESVKKRYELFMQRLQRTHVKPALVLTN